MTGLVELRKKTTKFGNSKLKSGLNLLYNLPRISFESERANSIARANPIAPTVIRLNLSGRLFPTIDTIASSLILLCDDSLPIATGAPLI